MLFNVKDGLNLWDYRTCLIIRCYKIIKFYWRCVFRCSQFSFHYLVCILWKKRLIRFVIKRNRKWKILYKMCYALMVTFYQSNVNNLENYLIIFFLPGIVKLVSYNRYTMHFIVGLDHIRCTRMCFFFYWNEIYLKLFKIFNFRKREFCLYFSFYN